MKLLRYGPPGGEKPGLLDDAGCIRDLSGIVADLSGEHLSREGLSRISSLQVSQLDIVSGAPRIGPPVGRVGHFIAVGLNYIDHAHDRFRTSQSCSTRRSLLSAGRMTASCCQRAR